MINQTIQDSKQTNTSYKIRAIQNGLYEVTLYKLDILILTKIISPDKLSVWKEWFLSHYGVYISIGNEGGELLPVANMGFEGALSIKHKQEGLK